MKNIGIMAVLGFFFILLVAAPAFAGEMAGAEKGSHTQGQTSMEAISIDKLTGMDVTNREGKVIGEISAYQVDETGNVRFLVVASGGYLGIGEKERLVPFAAFAPGAEADALILTVDENLLATSPTRAPGMTEEAFSVELYEHYGQAPYWTIEVEAIPEGGKTAE